MTDKVQKIRKEVERIQLYSQSGVLKQILDFIDSLQEEPVSEDTMTIRKEWFEHCKESWYNEGYIDGKYNRDRQFKEPISEDLEEAAKQYANDYLFTTAPTRSLTDHFKAGAKWQYDKFERERIAHCDSITPEQAVVESDFVVNHLKKHKRTPTFIDAIEYGKNQVIDVVCDWLANHSYDYLEFGEAGFGANFDYSKLIEDFRDYMKGG